MEKIKLSKRLDAIYRLIPFNGGAADVGTDHGFIPAALVLDGFVFPVYATDIKQGPLDSARRFAAAHGVENKISFHLCDGLSALDGYDISTVIIAGMGGETIASILADAPWTKENGRLLILQPMSKADRLRQWLLENSYRVLSERLVEDGPIYQILTVSGGNGLPPSPAELLIGRYSLIKSDPLFPRKLDELIAKAKAAFDGLSASANPEKLKALPEYRETLDSLLNMRERYYKENENG